MTDQNAGLSREFIEQQRKRLEALREQLLGGEDKGIANARACQEEHGEEAQEFEERAQRMAQNEVDQARYDTDEQRLSNIDRALRKIEEGTYGLSDASGKPIPQARLEATPEAIVEVQEERREERK